MKRFAFMLIAIAAGWALCHTPTVAQEARADQAPFTWKTSGETLEDFKVELVPAKPLDQSSAEACVKSFLSLADGRESAVASLGGLERKVESVVESELQQNLKLALTPELISSPELKKTETRTRSSLGGNWTLRELNRLDMYWNDSPSQWRKNPEDTPVLPDDAGFAVSRRLDRDGVPSLNVIEFGFQCRADKKGNWRIRRIMWRHDREEGPVVSSPWGEPEFRPGLPLRGWQPAANPYLRLKMLRESPPTKEYSDDSLQNVVEAFFSGIVQHRFTLRELLGRRVLQAWVDAVSPLLHADWIAELKAAEVPSDPEVADPTSCEIIEERDNPLCVVVQMNDPQRRSWLVFIRKKGDGYQITKLQRRFTAIRVRDGVEVEFLEDADSIWDVAREPVLTSYQLPIFLVG